ncbi:MAG: polymer-forming cytoskeletal protein [Nitrospirae bacterium]|nr:polymer-forming cytoskeletal protein [Nitrospirota bacterium]MDE3039190.1 polymer-forming cytoskeletal protein [Nitrospirota bacterium]MDE3051228.1 polymer-forming cytoskeletal protein [Nitrospirota bacterium]MDE3217809.1 polymer-forming cytoskeletal protein [Nitrospirota bacterium]
MWGQEKKEETNSGEQDDKEVTKVDASSIAEGAGDVSAFVGKGVEFKGTISYSGTVRIDGYLDGEIHTDGVLLIGEDAVIQAKITAGTIVCKGKITGDVVAKERVKLRAPAVMNGSVKAPILSMEDGVLFNGALEMAHGVRELPRDASLHPVGMIMPPDIKRVNG